MTPGTILEADVRDMFAFVNSLFIFVYCLLVSEFERVLGSHRYVCLSLFLFYFFISWFGTFWW